MIPILALAAAATPASATVIASDDFSKRPSDSVYSRCLYPYDTLLGHCTALGGGEATAWPPAWGVSDPLLWRPGYVGLPAVALTPGHRAAIEQQIAAQPRTPASIDALLRADKWATAWIQTKALFPNNTRTTVHLLPGACPSSWTGVYLWAEANRAEIDFGEIDCKAPTGLERITNALHWKDAQGVAHVLACPSTVKRDWMDVSVERRPDKITFLVNGKPTCNLTPPPELDTPLSLIMFQNERNTVPGQEPSTTWVANWKVEDLAP